jgi:hypothetical protein
VWINSCPEVFIVKVTTLEIFVKFCSSSIIVFTFHCSIAHQLPLVAFIQIMSIKAEFELNTENLKSEIFFIFQSSNQQF